MMDDHKTVEPFWETKSLDEMDSEEWESLCDGCGKCCLIKLEDVDSGEIAFTGVACRLLNLTTCACTNYPMRSVRVPECIQVTSDLARNANWLPATCAYRLLAEGKKLQWWHPLISGNPQSVHDAGISVQHRVMHESRDIDPEDHIVSWTE